MSLQKRISSYSKNLTRLESDLLDKLLKNKDKFNNFMISYVIY